MGQGVSVHREQFSVSTVFDFLLSDSVSNHTETFPSAQEKKRDIGGVS